MNRFKACDTVMAFVALGLQRKPLWQLLTYVRQENDEHIVSRYYQEKKVSSLEVTKYQPIPANSLDTFAEKNIDDVLNLIQKGGEKLLPKEWLGKVYKHDDGIIYLAND